MRMNEGHNKPCYYCKKSCNNLAGNPNDWPIPLCHSDDPGAVQWHHIGCVSIRLVENLDIKTTLDNLTNDERMEIFYHYCRDCGSKNPSCQCWNDE